MDPKFIRNFCIIAHIDHGKSTLADRLLEMTGALTSREMHEQVLDSMDLERERGITIKAKSIRLHYKAKDGNTYRLNLIDTPGHVDFSYEVSRALSPCEGALLVARLPPPKGSAENPLQALIFDSWFDIYRGAVVLVRVMEGRIAPHTKIRLGYTNEVYEVETLGTLTPKPVALEELEAGDLGFIVANIKRVAEARMGDTVTDASRPAPALPGFEAIKPMVFAGMFPVLADEDEPLRDALGKLQLNDAAFFYEPENSVALGFGFRWGFLGLLHMEIVQERLEREFNLTLLGTAPTVEYRVRLRSGEEVPVDNPDHLPDPGQIEAISEPMVLATIVVPSTYVGNMMELSQDRRGQFLNMQYEPGDRVVITYRMPLAEIIHDYYDQLKSRSKGYASLNYELVGFEEGDLVKLDVLVAGSPVDALSMIVDRSKAQQQGRRLAEKLKTLIPRQLFEVPIQAAIGGKIVARETVPAMRKDVTAKCYGGDVTRKRKLLEKQKEGKKRLKRVGNVEIPQEAFMAVLSLD